MRDNHNGCTSSSEVARQRLRQMKDQTIAETSRNSCDADPAIAGNDQRLYNSVPDDNNKAWEGTHNKLSSKGD